MRKIDLNNFSVARSQTARDINRRILLNLIREREPISRAALARHSGLQPSTVSAIAEQLIGERWVVEGVAGALPRGRKPTLLHLNTERVGIIGVDVRPTTSRLAVGGIAKPFLAQETIATGTDPGDFIGRLGRRIVELKRVYPKISYEGIGISLAGRIDPAGQRLIFAPNLGWTSVDFKTPLERLTGLSVELENAANACALAEMWSGRHPRANSLVAVTVSEGIGVGMIMNGQIVRGSTGLAGEFGHVSLVTDGLRCRCGNAGCWEVLASNSAALRYYSETASVRGSGGVSRSAPSKLAFADLLRLAEQGDLKAISALKQMAHYLGVGLAMLVTGLAPDVLVVVGDVTRAWDRLGPIVGEALKLHSFTHAQTRVLPTDPDAQPRLRGTIELVLQKHFGALPLG